MQKPLPIKKCPISISRIPFDNLSVIARTQKPTIK
jgi:hypothetical protein